MLKHVHLKSTILCIFSFFAVPFLINAQVKDIEGNIYKTCVIGNYELMAENLSAGRFRNGDKIIEAKTNEEWMEAGKNGIPAWCYYNNDPENGKKYGKLYNMHVFDDDRNIAPAGWKIIAHSTWDSLTSIVKWEKFWIKMKSTSGWHLMASDFKPGTNETGFNITAGGYRSGKDGSFNSLSTFTYFWRGMKTGGTHNEALGISNLAINGKFYSENVNYEFPLGVYIRCEKLQKDQDPFYFPLSAEEALNLYDNIMNQKGIIGEQVWSTENLNTDRFRNGDLIPEAATREEWAHAAKNGQPAWCYYPDNEKFGKLYNWYAVNDPRGIAPEGWHIPSKEEVNKLVNFLGGKEEAAKKMKTTTSWVEQGGSTNSSGFSALPGGVRTSDGTFLNVILAGHFWTTSLSTDKIRPVMTYHMSVGPLNFYPAFFGEGCSVRCIKN